VANFKTEKKKADYFRETVVGCEDGRRM